MTHRPSPPESLLADHVTQQFVPAPDLVQWARETFIEDSATLHNPEHQHLNHALIGALWTNVPNGRHGRIILAQCETGAPRAMGKWAKARAEVQIEQWFGGIPDFILTFDAGYAATCSDVEWCALVEHELLHAAQERDAFGAPKFSKSTGRPKFAIRGHDVEEFTSIVRRYGAEPAHAQAFIDAAKKGPEIGRASIAHACGVCLRQVA
ncbi:hypothetical protein D1227_06355 [Henriciella mobilis]|uniref:putative metallopeptidase n=1 Tax=Henriciella mobilis TaxID=2305467 RepID=UPI000E675606|nr:putative metallopeptidase [Henriciella mobilis]RIJ15967.1 hypothetical protein D1231_09245 [Henriciella mobilis]RIJ21177.1 hypothetical protein D1227_12785 [Henriciella mobilis]RIJ23122.1 hypothetical protein D1227_06355 [Henriciella mobilis]